jgi:hypothetical protein
MNDVLAIAGRADQDLDLVEEVARRQPREVMIVIDDEDRRADPGWAVDETPTAHAIRDRLARLLTLVETRTGAAVTGSVGDLKPLRGRWYDAIVDPQLPRAALR